MLAKLGKNVATIRKTANEPRNVTETGTNVKCKCVKRDMLF